MQAIGEITFDDPRRKAILTHKGVWKSEDKDLELHLNTLFKLEGWWTSPSQGTYGAALLHEAAQAVGGKPKYLIEYSEGNPNTVY